MAAEHPPKRVILRLRCNEFDDTVASYNEATFPSWGDRLAKHDPCASFYIILDMNAAAIKEPDLERLPHEMYRVRRQKDDGTP
ncbi:unnamed protein product [Parascedosporium putredinis]|uniref:Uncharacterized protein n=1 Tax=Parascedosporium putredinis TaxID=1442378 RepID=A0A9P1HB38_9PEZI|nr:unnamed protein product [Parascedosporium putredinis]CAI8002818.1 unnamed protein product [Parascedosporium putredinis]